MAEASQTSFAADPKRVALAQMMMDRTTKLQEDSPAEEAPPAEAGAAAAEPLKEVCVYKACVRACICVCLGGRILTA